MISKKYGFNQVVLLIALGVSQGKTATPADGDHTKDKTPAKPGSGKKKGNGEGPAVNNGQDIVPVGQDKFDTETINVGLGDPEKGAEKGAPVFRDKAKVSFGDEKNRVKVDIPFEKALQAIAKAIPAVKDKDQKIYCVKNAGQYEVHFKSTRSIAPRTYFDRTHERGQPTNTPNVDSVLRSLPNQTTEIVSTIAQPYLIVPLKTEGVESYMTQPPDPIGRALPQSATASQIKTFCEGLAKLYTDNNVAASLEDPTTHTPIYSLKGIKAGPEMWKSVNSSDTAYYSKQFVLQY